jgi:Tat protein secretion system quality control protein TatD with DNase activity
VHYSDRIKAIADEIPDHLLLTETDNPGGLKWLNGELGMPGAIANVVETVAGLRQSTPERIERLVHGNFARLIQNDPWLQDIQALLARPEGLDA